MVPACPCYFNLNHAFADSSAEEPVEEEDLFKYQRYRWL